MQASTDTGGVGGRQSSATCVSPPPLHFPTDTFSQVTPQSSTQPQSLRKYIDDSYICIWMSPAMSNLPYENLIPILVLVGCLSCFCWWLHKLKRGFFLLLHSHQPPSCRTSSIAGISPHLHFPCFSSWHPYPDTPELLHFPKVSPAPKLILIRAILYTTHYPNLSKSLLLTF